MTYPVYRPAKSDRSKGLFLILAVVTLVVGMLVFQVFRYRYHRPLLIAEAAAADSEGEARFEALGAPPGAAPTAPGEKRASAQSPEAPPKRITWRREYEVPGTFESALGWYRDRLLADGWQEESRGAPSGLARYYRKDKWLVTISRRADFDHPPRARVELQLEWYYWHRHY